MKYMKQIFSLVLLCVVYTATAAENGVATTSDTSGRGKTEQSAGSREKRATGDQRVDRGFKDKTITDAPPPKHTVSKQKQPPSVRPTPQ